MRNITYLDGPPDPAKLIRSAGRNQRRTDLCSTLCGVLHPISKCQPPALWLVPGSVSQRSSVNPEPRSPALIRGRVAQHRRGLQGDLQPFLRDHLRLRRYDDWAELRCRAPQRHVHADSARLGGDDAGLGERRL
eukprot:668770-Rhodomonas_salina.2